MSIFASVAIIVGTFAGGFLAGVTYTIRRYRQRIAKIDALSAANSELLKMLQDRMDMNDKARLT